MGTIVTCDEPELQFRSGQHLGIGSISPNGGSGVLSQSSDIEVGESEVEEDPSQETVTTIPFRAGKNSKKIS